MQRRGAAALLQATASCRSEAFHTEKGRTHCVRQVICHGVSVKTEDKKMAVHSAVLEQSSVITLVYISKRRHASGACFKNQRCQPALPPGPVPPPRPRLRSPRPPHPPPQLKPLHPRCNPRHQRRRPRGQPRPLPRRPRAGLLSRSSGSMAMRARLCCTSHRSISASLR